LWGGSKGVYGTFLTRELETVRQDTPISAGQGTVRHPSGAFRNDTLFVVWEDYRNGTADIYGNWRYLPGTASVHEPEDTTGQHGDGGKDTTTIHPPDTSQHIAGANPLTLLSITPNPAFNSSTVSFSLSAPSSVAVDLFDLLGRLAYHGDAGLRPAGESSWRIDAAGLPDGVYTVVIRNGNGRGTGRLILYHR
jgi:hypothetical protein